MDLRMIRKWSKKLPQRLTSQFSIIDMVQFPKGVSKLV